MRAVALAPEEPHIAFGKAIAVTDLSQVLGALRVHDEDTGGALTM